MVTPPFFRLEGKQANTVRIFPNAYISKAPQDRETVYFFNVMPIPPTSDSEADKKLQLAVRHRMRLIYRPHVIQDMNITTEAKNLQWRKSGNKITLKNPTPFFIYFKSIIINGRDITSTVNNIDAFSSKNSLYLPVLMVQRSSGKFLPIMGAQVQLTPHRFKFFSLASVKSMSISIKKMGGALSATYHTFFVLVPALALGLSANDPARDFFDSVTVTGIQLATDTDMIPESLRGFAPVVRGIARTNARIVIKQNGYQIYQAFVAPGAFEITDLYSTGGNGDLYVTVEESDGSRQNFVVPYASLLLMLREGQMEYEFTSGKYRPYDVNIDERPFTQATIGYGVLSNATLYTGLQAASNYQALAFGARQNLGDIGAVSADVTTAWSSKKDEDKTSGQSWRIRYGKNILETGTNITVAGYSYAKHSQLINYGLSGGVLQ